MSQGNRISQGGKGTNYPYQSKVLKGLQQSIDELIDINANTSLITGLATETTLLSVDTTTTNAYTELLNQGLTLDDIETALNALNSIAATEATLNAVDTKLNSIIVTPSLIRATGAGTISAGAYSFSVANVGLLDGILLGVAIRPGEIISFDAGSLNNTYGAVSYDGTGTELLITVNS